MLEKRSSLKVELGTLKRPVITGQPSRELESNSIEKRPLKWVELAWSDHLKSERKQHLTKRIMMTLNLRDHKWIKASFHPHKAIMKMSQICL